MAHINTRKRLERNYRAVTFSLYSKRKAMFFTYLLLKKPLLNTIPIQFSRYFDQRYSFPLNAKMCLLNFISLLQMSKIYNHI